MEEKYKIIEKEYKQAIFHKNMLHFVFSMFGILCYSLVLILLDLLDIEITVFEQINMAFYAFLSVLTALFGLILYFLYNKFNKHLKYKNLLFYYGIFAILFQGISICIFNPSNSVAYLLFAALWLICLLIYDLSLKIYLYSFMIPFVVLSPYLLMLIDKATYGLLLVYYTLICFIVIYLCKIRQDTLKNSIDLKIYASNLEFEIGEQTTKLVEKNEDTMALQNQIIISLANLIENRDNDTGEHIKRTSIFVEKIAKKAKENGYFSDVLTDDYIDLLVKAAPLHDIGKIVVSDSILKAPRRLTTEEFEIMKTHTTEGARIISDVLENIESYDYIDMAAKIAKFHHEKWNGNGYPLGLKGERIPLSARIMAISDVFDALVSKRVYKDSFSLEESFQLIEDGSGNHFDPILVEVFKSIEEDIRAVVANENLY